MTKSDLKTRLESLTDSLDAIIRSSPGILPKEPTTQEIVGYSSALTSLSFAMKDIDRAIVHLGEMEGGDAGT